jgi:hypothetical protein
VPHTLARLVESLGGNIPSDKVHLTKRIKLIDEAEDLVHVLFEDATTVEKARGLSLMKIVGRSLCIFTLPSKGFV